tara:strand:- start:284 stop:409 length:126 start_codon:yes stop_codon:yes gene_type:complete
LSLFPVNLFTRLRLAGFISVWGIGTAEVDAGHLLVAKLVPG